MIEGRKIVQSRPLRFDVLLGAVFRVVVRECRIGQRPERAHLEMAAYACRLLRVHDIDGAPVVDRLESAPAALADDGDEMDDGIDAVQRRRQCRGLGHIPPREVNTRRE